MSHPRLLFYSPDTYGLGHLRRSLTLAREFVSRFEGASILLATGSPCATHFRIPDGIDLLKLPSVTKDEDGHYVSRSLGLKLSELVEVRQQLLLGAFDSYRPDLVLVDHSVLGVGGELRALLSRARATGAKTLLGLRDILDDPRRVELEWGGEAARAALVDGYDQVCVYGDREVFDTGAEYSLPPEVARRLRFVGYVTEQGARQPIPSVSGPARVLVTVGGGQDGQDVVVSYLDALDVGPAPSWESQVLLGPMFDTRVGKQLKERARAHPSVTFHRFHGDVPHLLAEARVVVSMAGYNTVAECLAQRTRAILLPRTQPRKEQLLRARRMHELGLAHMVEEPHPKLLRAAIEHELRTDADWGNMPRLDGASSLADLVREMIDSDPIEVRGEARR